LESQFPSLTRSCRRKIIFVFCRTSKNYSKLQAAVVDRGPPWRISATVTAARTAVCYRNPYQARAVQLRQLGGDSSLSVVQLSVVQLSWQHHTSKPAPAVRERREVGARACRRENFWGGLGSSRNGMIAQSAERLRAAPRWLFRHAGWSRVRGWSQQLHGAGVFVALGVAAAGEVALKPGRELLVSTDLESRGAVKSTKKLSKCRKQAR
jgi:hypothetical protein